MDKSTVLIGTEKTSPVFQKVILDISVSHMILSVTESSLGKQSEGVRQQGAPNCLMKQLPQDKKMWIFKLMH